MSDRTVYRVVYLEQFVMSPRNPDRPAQVLASSAADAGIRAARWSPCWVVDPDDYGWRVWPSGALTDGRPMREERLATETAGGAPIDWKRNTGAAGGKDVTR